MSINADCAKVLKTIASCQNYSHLDVANKMIDNFNKMYDGSSLDFAACCREIMAQSKGFVFSYYWYTKQKPTYPVNDFMKARHAAAIDAFNQKSQRMEAQK